MTLNARVRRNNRVKARTTATTTPENNGSLRSYDCCCNKNVAKIELCIRLNVLRLLHVGRVARNSRGVLLLAWQKWFSCKGREWNIHCCGLALSWEPQIWQFHVVIWQLDCVKKLHQKACRTYARLLLFIRPIKSLICGVVVAVAVIIS